MKRSEYLKRAFHLYNSGKVSGEVYDAMQLNADIFCDADEEGGLPETYAEVEYDDFENFNRGNDCGTCEHQYMTGRDGTVSACRMKEKEFLYDYYMERGKETEANAIWKEE